MWSVPTYLYSTSCSRALFSELQLKCLFCRSSNSLNYLPAQDMALPLLFPPPGTLCVPTPQLLSSISPPPPSDPASLLCPSALVGSSALCSQRAHATVSCEGPEGHAWLGPEGHHACVQGRDTRWQRDWQRQCYGPDTHPHLYPPLMSAWTLVTNSQPRRWSCGLMGVGATAGPHSAPSHEGLQQTLRITLAQNHLT